MSEYCGAGRAPPPEAELAAGDPERGHLASGLLLLAELEFRLVPADAKRDAAAARAARDRAQAALDRAVALEPSLDDDAQGQLTAQRFVAFEAQAAAQRALRRAGGGRGGAAAVTRFAKGDVVELRGLTGARAAALNGQRAVVEADFPAGDAPPSKGAARAPSASDAEEARASVRLPSEADPLSVNGSNLVLVRSAASHATVAAATAGGARRDARFFVGDVVAVEGLASEKGRPLNGRRGLVVAEPSEQRERYEVFVAAAAAEEDAAGALERARERGEGRLWDIPPKNLARPLALGEVVCAICLEVWDRSRVTYHGRASSLNEQLTTQSHCR